MSCRARPTARSMILAITLSFLGSVVFGQDCSKQASEYRQGVVSLTVKKTQKETGKVIEANGTGFVVAPQGYVFTADHIVARDDTIDSIKLEGSIGSLYAQNSPLRVVEEDKASDIALLQFLDDSHIYVPVRLGSPWSVLVGEELCSLGFSAPLHADYRTTTGSLSALSGQDDANGVYNLWTTQLPSNVGESGAPVLQLPSGGVIAIKYGGERPSVAQNVNYVIPLNLAQPLLLKYMGLILPRAGILGAGGDKWRLEKTGGDESLIPVGGWRNFEVKVVDDQGRPVQGAKVAWQTPEGGPLTYVAETDAAGVARATNLYTFPRAGRYTQTAKIVSKGTPTGFTQADKIVGAGPSTLFTFQEN
jgi:S1-C subfamily serine protease